LTWLSNVVQFVKCMSGSQPPAHGELHPARRLRREAFRPHALLRHPLILDGFIRLRAFRRSGGCKCLHVLSSFQRTGPPDPAPSRTPEAHSRARQGRASLRVFLLRGNLPILLEDSNPCQSHAALFFALKRAAPGCEREAVDYGEGIDGS
jgi:hypothetical protein